MKPCVNCGSQLPDEAAFCPFCETEQTPSEAVRPPRVWRRKTAIICAALAVIAIAAAVLYSALRPRVFIADGPELNYRGYHVFLTFQLRGETYAPEASASRTIPSHADYSRPTQLYAFKKNDTVNAREAFLDLIAKASMVTVPLDGASQMDYSEPAESDVFPNAVLKADVYFDTTCGTNDVIWTIDMKNGDRIILRHSMIVIPQPEAAYYSADYDMTTMEALQALLKEIEAKETPDTLVSIYLPPVTYEGRLTIAERAYYFYGSTDGYTATTFTDTVTVDTQIPISTEFHSVRFAGSGGTGLLASRSVTVEECTFTGWDIGATASDGGWLGVHDCEFIGNGVALQYNTGNCSNYAEECDDCLFQDNGIAVHFARVRTDIYTLRFTRTVFRGNGENIRNETKLVPDLAEAILE